MKVSFAMLVFAFIAEAVKKKVVLQRPIVGPVPLARIWTSSSTWTKGLVIVRRKVEASSRIYRFKNPIHEISFSDICSDKKGFAAYNRRANSHLTSRTWWVVQWPASLTLACLS